MPEKDELDLLKERADKMQIKYHPAIGVDSLKDKINKVLVGSAPENTGKESIADRNARLRKEANKLVRVRVTMMNPNKRDWPGEIISVSNSAIGTIKKFIPFTAEDPWHIPQVILTEMQDKKFQQFVTIKIPGTTRTRKVGKLVKEYGLEIMEPLTHAELVELADRQMKQASGE